MAKISNYSFASSPSATDWLLGTDIENSYTTNNFKISDVLKLTNKGVFYDTTNQTAAVINTAYPIKLNTVNTSLTTGFTIANNGSGNPTRITASNDAIYNLVVSAQVYNASGTDAVVDIWVRVNGNDIVYSNTSITVKASSNYNVITRNFSISLISGQYAEIMWATTNISAQFSTTTSTGVRPAAPSVSVTINQI